jgi:hypothetical protein
VTDTLSNRYFRSLSDAELLLIFIRRDMAWSVNASRANREARRRAAKAGLSHAQEWLHMVASRPNNRNPQVKL